MADKTNTAATLSLQEVEAWRLAAFANGYTPIRNHDKRTFMKGWPQAVIDEREIQRWSRRFSRDLGTGIRVEDGLAVIDIDIDDKPLVARIFNRILDICPELENANVPLLIRSGKGAKEAIFVGTDELFSRIHSRAWVRPGDDVDAGAHRVEIFGGAVARQFGSFGPHTVAADGSIAVRYAWADRSPADTPKSELPVLTKAQFFAIVDAAEDELRAAGWSPVEMSQRGESDAVRVYDLTEDMQFDLDTGNRVSLLELRELAASFSERGGSLRCSAAPFDGPTAKRTDRCIVGIAANGGVTVWDSMPYITHCEATLKPRDVTGDLDRIAEKLKELAEVGRNKLDVTDSADVAATKLRATYAFCPYQRETVVPLWASSLGEGMTMTSFRTDMLKHSDIEIGPKGGTKRINPADLWSVDKRRVTVRGLRLRPDKERPTYEDRGHLWINVYDPPTHLDTGGDVAVGLEFMEQLLPDPRERSWFMQWLAHKYRRPDIPGPAVLMVAREFGTGRGTLGKLVSKLFGATYTKTVPFHIFAGRSYQSQYTEWAASAIMVLVNESAEANGGSVYSAKRDTYEHVKEMVDPRPVEREFVVKGEKSYSGVSFASYIISTNHIDALPIPADDRRFAVLSNGQPRDGEFWGRVNLWLDDDANVAAFARHLEEVDLSSYSPFDMPLHTKAKASMADAGRSDLDRGLEMAVEAMVGEVFVFENVVLAMGRLATEFGLDFPDKWEPIVRRLLKSKCYRVGEQNGRNWQPQIGGRRYAVFAADDRTANRWTPSERVREEVLKNGPLPGAANEPGVLLHLAKRKESK